MLKPLQPLDRATKVVAQRPVLRYARQVRQREDGERQTERAREGERSKLDHYEDSTAPAHLLPAERVEVIRIVELERSH